MGVGLNLALLKEIKSVTPFFFLKGIIIVHEIKINSLDFQHNIFNIRFILKNKFQFSTNCQHISCSSLSQLGITNKLVHFLKDLRPWAII